MSLGLMRKDRGLRAGGKPCFSCRGQSEEQEPRAVWRLWLIQSCQESRNGSKTRE